MSDWEDVPSSEWEDVPSSEWSDAPVEPPGWFDSLTTSLEKGIGNIAEGLGGGIKAIEDQTIGTGLGQYILDMEEEYQKPREELLSRVEKGSPQYYANTAIEGITSASPMLLAPGVGTAMATGGALGFGRQFDRAMDLGADYWPAIGSAAVTGLTDAATAFPIFKAAQATGPVLKQALASGAVNAGVAIPQSLAQAYADSVATGEAIDPFQAGQAARENMITSAITGAAFPLIPAAQRRVSGADAVQRGDVPSFSADELLTRMMADSPAPPTDNTVLNLPEPPQPAGLLPYSRDWVPENWNPGQDFLYRDYAALPPLDISKPQPVFSSLPPEPINWNFRGFEPDTKVFMPDEQLMIGFDGFPQSPVPEWELTPSYKRGVDFQYRDFGALPPALLDPPPQSPMPNWELSPNYKRGDGFQYRDFYSLPPALRDSTATAVEKETATLTTGKTAEPMVAAPTKIGDELFPNPIPQVTQAQEPRPFSLFEAESRQSNLVDVPVYSTEDVQQLAANVVPVEVPTAKLEISKDVPQWKSGANEKGETYQLGGTYSKIDSGMIAVHERLNGNLEVSSGRHRTAKAKRDGVPTVTAQIFREADGWTPEMMKTLDIELNIRDGKGSLSDFAHYFRGQKDFMTPEMAESRSLLNDEKGRLGFSIGAKASEDVWAAWKLSELKDRMAAAIADAAPYDAPLQAEGIRLAKKGMPAFQVQGALEMTRLLRDAPATSGVQGNMFAEDFNYQRDTDISAEAARVKKEKIDAILTEVASFEAAAKNPQLAQKRLGFKDQTPEQLLDEAKRLRFEAAKYNDLKQWPDKFNEVRTEAMKRLASGESARNDTAQRIASKRKKPIAKREVFGVEINPQGGKLSVDWIAELLNNKKLQKDLPDYKDVSATNKRYAKLWPQMLEWMDTTRRKNPQAAGFIDAYWKVPQDLNSITYDAKLTLEPYLALTAQERASVDNYLAAARVMASRSERAMKYQRDLQLPAGSGAGYKISPETAAKMGLNEKQTAAALAVNKWSNEMLNVLEDHAVRVAEHAEGKKGQTLASDKRKEISARFEELRNSNYVPFNRYGEHYINVFDKDGVLAYRYQFDSKSDTNYVKTKNQFESLTKQQGNDLFGGRVEYGRSDPPKLNEHDGVPSDILEILNDDGAQGEVRGFYKHLKPAALVGGQRLDLLRSISEYTTGAAKLVSLQRAKMTGERELLAMSPGGLRSPDNRNLERKLIAWADGFNQPTSPAFQAINNAFNVAYIGGNLRTPTADMLGRVQLQYPLMSKYLKKFEPETTFANGIGKEMRWWFSSDESFSKAYPELSGGIREAQRKGIIPTNIYKTFLRNARGESQGASAFKNKVHDLYFGLKEISERSTDLGGFILGWEMYPRYMEGKGAGKETRSRQQFAEDFVRESRAVPSQAELPAAFRKETVRLATKYRLYQAKILKSLSQAGWGQWARYLASTGLTTGVVGTIFARDIFSAARFGGIEPEDKLREMGLGSEVMYGPMSALTGIDFSGSAGFGEIFPGAGGNMVSKALLGMAGAPFEAATRAFNYYERGQNNKAIGSLPFMPNPVSNFLTQKDWGERGVVTLGGKAVIPRDEVRGVDRFKKLLGYQPLRVKEAMVLENRKKQAANTGRATGFYNQRVGEALGLGNVEEAQALIQQAQEEGVKLNTNSVKNYAAKIQGRDGTIPKKARGEVKRVEQLYGSALRD